MSRNKHSYGALMEFRNTLKSILAKRNPISAKDRTKLWFAENKYRIQN
jgi:hypothetical protein